MRNFNELSKNELMHLSQSIQESFALLNYNHYQKMSKFIKPYKWILGIAFAIGFINVMFFENPDNSLIVLNAVLWIPGIVYAFGMAILHIMVTQKLREFTIHYNLVQNDSGLNKELKEFVHEELN